jgi:hypothetical protein
MMKRSDWPNWRKGALFGMTAGLTLASAWMGWMVFVSTLPVVSPVSISVAFSPWWRASNWVSAGFVFVVVGGITMILVAFRPTMRKLGR